MLHPRWILGLWIMAMLSLCGGDDTCQSLLTLDPPEVVGELGDNVLVNCTTSEEVFEEIFWTDGSTESEHEDESSFYALSLSLSEWNMAARCTVKLNETFKCSKDLKITVYNIPSPNLTFPNPMLEGKNYELECDLRDVAPVQNLRVTWFTGNRSLHTQTFDESSVTPVNVTSILNITAEKTLNGERLGCRAELDLGSLEPEFQPLPKSLDTPLNVWYPPVIHYCPEQMNAVELGHSLNMLPCYVGGNPKATFKWYTGGNLVNAEETLTRGNSGMYTAVAVNRLGRVEIPVKVDVQFPPEVRPDVEELAVDEGANVSLACGAEGLPLFFNWTCNGQNMNVSASFLNVSHVMTNTSCKCVASNFLGTANKTIHLRVATPQQATMPLAVATPPPAAADTGCPIILTPAEVVERFGDPVTINCTSTTAAFQGIVWEVPTGEVELVDTVATWRVRRMTNWSGKSRCILNLGDRLCSRVPNITLYKPPDSVLVRIPDLVVGGGDLQLTCDVISVAPVKNLKVKWFYGLEAMETHTFNQTASTPVNVSSSITVTAKPGHNEGVFRCEAELDLGPNGPKPPPGLMGEALVAVHYGPVFRGCPQTFTGFEKEVTLDKVPCKLDGNPAASLQWYHQGRLINASEPLGRTGSGVYVAKAENIVGTSNFTLNVSVEYEPSLSCQPSYEVLENDELQAVCKTEGLPWPVFSWFRDGKELRSSHQWKKDDRGDYLLRATNRHGGAEQKLFIDVLYAPRFNKGNFTVEVTPGGSVLLECFADANPSPEIQWIFRPAANVVNTTGWRRSVLTVSEATPTNAGVYMCVASNRLGSVTRFDTLIMKDQSSTFLAEVFWGLMILLVVLMIIGLVVCFTTCKTRSKHRRYSFVPSSSRNDSERSFPLNEVPVWMHN